MPSQDPQGKHGQDTSTTHPQEAEAVAGKHILKVQGRDAADGERLVAHDNVGGGVGGDGKEGALRKEVLQLRDELNALRELVLQRQ